MTSLDHYLSDNDAIDDVKKPHKPAPEDPSETLKLLHGHEDKHHHHKESRPLFKRGGKLLCWKNPPNWLMLILEQITLERIKIGIIFIFVFAAAIAFAVSHEEELEVLDLAAVSRMFPLIIDVGYEGQRSVLEALIRVQEISEEELGTEFPQHVNVFLEVQGSNNNLTWVRVGALEVVESQPEESELFIIDFYLNDHAEQFENYRWNISTNSQVPVGITFEYRVLFALVQYEVLIAAFVLVGVYILIVFELMHRTIAAMLGSFVCLGVLAIVHGRPSFEEVIFWIDFETVGLLFGMMIMVGIFSETGFFEWTAIKAYKFSKGNVWHLTLILCIFTAGISAVLDNVTTILLMTPVTVRLCRVLDIEPQPILLALVVMSNIGGTATVIGDPPNIIIVNDKDVAAHGDITFTSFTIHVLPGVLIAGVCVQIMIYFFHRQSMTRKPHQAKQRELDIWKNTVKKIRDEDEDERRVREQLNEYIMHLQSELEAQPATARVVDISDLERQYVIRDKPLFVSSVIVLSGVISMFFLHSWIEEIVELNLAWIAIIGALIHLLVSGIKDVEEILEKVELGTLLFFAGLFVLMHGLDLLGLIDFIGDAIYNIIVKVPEGNGRLSAAIVLIIWVSAFTSAFIDNIPYTTAMVPVIVSLAESDLGLPLAPLVWALSYGTCFGGNGTLIGASANVVAVGLAEQQGFPITFVRFFKTGFPCMVLSVTCATIYLLITHVLIPWY